MAFFKLREKEGENEKLVEQKREILKQTEEKEAEMDAKTRASGGRVKKDLKKYGAQVSVTVWQMFNYVATHANIYVMILHTGTRENWNLQAYAWRNLHFAKWAGNIAAHRTDSEE